MEQKPLFPSLSVHLVRVQSYFVRNKHRLIDQLRQKQNPKKFFFSLLIHTSFWGQCGHSWFHWVIQISSHAIIILVLVANRGVKAYFSHWFPAERFSRRDLASYKREVVISWGVIIRCWGHCPSEYQLVVSIATVLWPSLLRIYQLFIKRKLPIIDNLAVLELFYHLDGSIKLFSWLIARFNLYFIYWRFQTLPI